MIEKLIVYLKNKPVHTPRIALARFLLALGMLITVSFNDLNVVANHQYKYLPDYAVKRYANQYSPLRKAILFQEMPQEQAKVVVIVILLLVMSGFFPQVTGLLHFWACFSYHNYFLIVNGGDEVALIISILLIPICLTDPRLNQWKRTPAVPSSRNITGNLAMIVIHMQAAAIYLDAAISKFWTREWQTGTALYNYTSHYRLGSPNWLKGFNELITLSPAVFLLSWFILAFEIAVALCLFFPNKVKRKFLIPALVFHFLIVVNFGLFTFFLSMAGLLVLFLGRDQEKGLIV